MLVTIKLCLLWETYMFVATKLLSWQILVATNIILSRQKFCCDKHMLLMAKDVFCHDKHVLQQKWYLWQLPPVIAVTQSMQLYTDRMRRLHGWLFPITLPLGQLHTIFRRFISLYWGQKLSCKEIMMAEYSPHSHRTMPWITSHITMQWITTC